MPAVIRDMQLLLPTHPEAEAYPAEAAPMEAVDMAAADSLEVPMIPGHAAVPAETALHEAAGHHQAEAAK